MSKILNKQEVFFEIYHALVRTRVKNPLNNARKALRAMGVSFSNEETSKWIGAYLCITHKTAQEFQENGAETARVLSTKRRRNGAENIEKRRKISLCITPDLFTDFDEKQVAAFVAIQAGKNKSSRISDARVASIRNSLAELQKQYSLESWRYGLERANNKEAGIPYAEACMRGYKAKEAPKKAISSSRADYYKEIGEKRSGLQQGNKLLGGVVDA